MDLDDLTFYSMYALLQSGMWLLSDLESSLMPHGLSQGRLSILLNIHESDDGNINPAELALLTGKSRPTVTKMVERLLKDQLITVSKDHGDGRRKSLSITEKGRDLLKVIVPEYNKRISKMSHNLSQEDKKNLLAILGKMDFLDSRKRIRGV